MVMEAVPTARQFKYDGKTYVRIPELNLQCGEHGFLMNCIRIVDKGEFEPPLRVGEYIHDKTDVVLL